jgi:hypothetical protein
MLIRLTSKLFKRRSGRLVRPRGSVLRSGTQLKEREHEHSPSNLPVLVAAK